MTDAELNQMKHILYEAMQAGAFGFSADKNLEDRTEDGSALPSHVASPEEFLALAEVLSEFGVGHLGWTIGISDQRQEQQTLLTEMMVRSGRPLHVAVGDDEDGYTWAEQARAEGLPVVVQQNSMDLVAEFTLAEYNLFDYMPNWIQPLVGTAAERAQKLRDPHLREAMKRDVEERPHSRTNWSMMHVAQATQERNLRYEGLSIAAIAAEQGKHPLDAFLDLALDEDLQMVFTHAVAYRGEEKLARRIAHPLCAYLAVRWWGPRPILDCEYVARALPDLLDPRETAHDPGTGTLQDECLPGMDRQLQKSWHVAPGGLG